MSLTIHKYPVAPGDFTLDLPLNAQALSVQVQHGQPQLWMLVDASEPTAPRRFAIRGTGHPCDGLRASHYLGTFQLDGGALVFHLFERPA